MVTNLIIDRLEAGVVPWQMPWKSANGIPCNLISKKGYRGFNFWYLLSFNFERPYFLTFNQVQELNAKIRKGSKSYPVVFWKMLDVTKQDGTTEQIPFLRYYNVYHVDDVDGIAPEKIPSEKSNDRELNPIGECERLIELWDDSPVIEFGRGQAAYSPGLDKVYMPSQRDFFTDEGYYAVLFHELVHSTGHKKRLNRHEKFPDHKFGSQDYSQEELVAEMGAAYLCGICGIENRVDQSASYIKGWLRRFKDDNKIVVTAASYAQKAVDYIMEHQRQPSPVSEIMINEEAVVASFEF